MHYTIKLSYLDTNFEIMSTSGQIQEWWEIPMDFLLFCFSTHKMGTSTTCKLISKILLYSQNEKIPLPRCTFFSVTLSVS